MFFGMKEKFIKESCVRMFLDKQNCHIRETFFILLLFFSFLKNFLFKIIIFIILKYNNYIQQRMIREATTHTSTPRNMKRKKILHYKKLEHFFQLFFLFIWFFSVFLKIVRIFPLKKRTNSSSVMT